MQSLVLAGRTNRIIDPQLRNAVASATWTAGNGTPTRVASPFWLAAGSVQFVVSSVSGNPSYGTPSASGSAYKTAVAAAEHVSGGLRVLAAQANRAGCAVVTFYNAAGTQLAVVNGPWTLLSTDPGRWTTLQFDGFVAPATTTYARVAATFSNTANVSGLGNAATIVGDTYYIGAGDVHLGDQYEGLYLDGNQPSGSWTGTAHLSTSSRAAIDQALFTPGRGGTISITPWLDVRDRNNVPVSDAKQLVLQGRVDFDTEAAIPMTFKGVTNNPDFFDPYKQFIAPHLDITWRDGRQASYQVGLFQVQPFSKTETNLMELGELVGMDVTALMAVRSYGDTKVVAVGTNIIQHVVDIITAQGFTRCNIPASSSVVTSKPMTWEPGTNKLKICNDLLVRAGYYPLWADRLGVLTSRPLDDLDNVQPAWRYVGGTGSSVVEPFVTDPQVDGLYNHIIVVKTQKGAAPIKQFAKNTNPASGYSINNIGERVLVIKDADIADNAAALRLAKKKLFDSGNVRVNCKMRTLIEPWHTGNEVYELHLANANGKKIREADGLFLCKGWSIGFASGEGVMEHKLYRILRYQSEV